MKQKLAAPLLALSIIAYALLLALALYRVGTARERALAQAEEDFMSLRLLAQSALAQGRSHDSKPFLEQMRRRYALSPRLRSLAIHENSGSLLYAIPAQSSIREIPAWTPASTGFFSFLDRLREKLLGLNVSLKRGEISGPGGSSLALSALYTAIPRREAMNAVRDSLIGSVGILFLAAVALLVLALGDDEETSDALESGEYRAETSGYETKHRSYSEEQGSSEDAHSSNLDSEGSETPTSYLHHPLLNEEFDIPRFSLDDSGSSQVAPEIEPSEIEQESYREIPADEDEEPEPSHYRGAAQSSASEASASSPASPYSPRSGLGWQSFLADRLGSELLRCASLELECSFLLINPDSQRPGAEAYPQAAARVQDYFGFKDISFEFGEEDFAVILPGKSLEEAFSAAKEFAAGRLPGARIGISSRSGRILAASTILEEASAALEKAQADPTAPIVGFRADPARYKNYVAGKL